MSKEKCIRKLRWYSLLSQIASLLVFTIGAVSIIFFSRPSILGVEAELLGEHQSQWIGVLFGSIFVVLGMFFYIFVYRWPRVLLRIVRTQPSSPMRFQLKAKEEGDRTQYNAYLTEPSSTNDPSTWCIRLWAVSSEIEGWLERVCSARVYLDPKTGIPAVIELEDMYLWAMKGEAKRI
jgi:hypothetical protein